MATFTTNYNLKKPDGDDFYNILDFNGNADIIDENLKSVSDSVSSQGASLSEIQSDISDLETAVLGKAPTNHASSTSTYGTGTSLNYGHVKLSDSVSSESASGAGIAATPKAVKTAYDLASSASSSADGKVSKFGDTMAGSLRVGAGSNHGEYQDGQIELYAPTPFIDFHYGNSSADFDMRIINDASGQLRITNQSNNAVLKVNSNDVLTTASSNYLFPDKNLNGTNIDTDTDYNYTVGLSEDGHGTRPQGDWMNIMNFHCGHFIAQIAIKCQNNGSAEGNQMWIRNKYLSGSWSGWSEICTKLNTLYIQSTQPSSPDNVLWAW